MRSVCWTNNERNKREGFGVESGHLPQSHPFIHPCPTPSRSISADAFNARIHWIKVDREQANAAPTTQTNGTNKKQ